MNAANFLTVVRFFLAAAFTALGSLDHVLPGAWLWALILFVIASLTDWLDGHIARKFSLITDFGKLMDPLADKVLVLAALLLLLQKNILPAWVAVIMLAREFLVTGLRLVAASKGTVLAAEGLGKHKTISQMTAILTALLSLALSDINAFNHQPLGMFFTAAVPWFFAWALIITIYSGAVYFWKNRRILSD
jgi:CDP-diacylglycerol--glycerol-3-phosphate 3-phosphatidyltransferase